MMEQSLLKFDHVTIKFKEDGRAYPAVTDLDFQIAKGEKAALIGESGCGKTVTALACMGLLSSGAVLSQGDIFFEGQSLTSLTEKEFDEIRGFDMSMIFQEPMTSLNPLIKVGKQIEENLLEHSDTDKKSAKAATLAMLKKVGLPDEKKMYNMYPHQLSGGMRQRIMIAMALINHPKLVIADEPTTALDVTIQAQILELLRTLNRENDTAVLLISHDLGLVNNICENAYIMYAGVIVEGGRVKDLLNEPMHPYTRGLMDSVPSIKNKGKPLHSIEGYVPSLEERSNVGCPFADRCEHCMKVCREIMPEPVNTGHSMVRCHLFNEEVRSDE